MNALTQKKSTYRNRVDNIVLDIQNNLRELLKSGSEVYEWGDYIGNFQSRLNVESISRDLEELLTLAFELQVQSLEGNLPTVLSEIDNSDSNAETRIRNLRESLDFAGQHITRALELVSNYTPWSLSEEE